MFTQYQTVFRADMKGYPVHRPIQRNPDSRGLFLESPDN